MKKGGRYDVSGLTEVRFEPDSNEQALKNRLGITSATAMNEAEARALEMTMLEIIGQYSAQHRFTADDIKAVHKNWLGKIYEWAGEYRQVNISKGISRSPPRREFRFSCRSSSETCWRVARPATSAIG